MEKQREGIERETRANEKRGMKMWKISRDREQEGRENRVEFNSAKLQPAGGSSTRSSLFLR